MIPWGDAGKLREYTVKQFYWAILDGCAQRTSAAITRRVNRLVNLTGLPASEIWKGLYQDARTYRMQRDAQTISIKELEPR